MIRRCASNGFTLVELLVVVSVIALLAALAVPHLRNANSSSRTARANTDLRVISDALNRHYLDRGSYPNKLGDLVKTGYLRGPMRFVSPTSGAYYFYAVDDSTGSARHFILGNSPTPRRDGGELHRSGNLPEGKAPTFRAWAWVTSSGSTLVLFAEDDTTHMPESEVPASLAFYRSACALSATGPCDVYSE